MMSLLRITLTATVTIMNALSSIGGTLGLFLGFSILSAAEIVYWGWKIGMYRVGKRKKNRVATNTRII